MIAHLLRAQKSESRILVAVEMDLRDLYGMYNIMKMIGSSLMTDEYLHMGSYEIQ